MCNQLIPWFFALQIPIQGTHSLDSMGFRIANPHIWHIPHVHSLDSIVCIANSHNRKHTLHPHFLLCQLIIITLPWYITSIYFKPRDFLNEWSLINMWNWQALELARVLPILKNISNKWLFKQWLSCAAGERCWSPNNLEIHVHGCERAIEKHYHV